MFNNTIKVQNLYPLIQRTKYNNFEKFKKPSVS